MLVKNSAARGPLLVKINTPRGPLLIRLRHELMSNFDTDIIRTGYLFSCRACLPW